MTPLEKKQHIDQLIENARKKLAALQAVPMKTENLNDLAPATNLAEQIMHIPMPEDVARANAQKANILTWNTHQQEAIDRALSGESFCLIGKAGTGKTTVTREFILQQIRSGNIPPLHAPTKWLTAGKPGVCIVSFTNRAVKNIAKGLPKELQDNALTVHKLIEFEPEYYEVKDADGNYINKMRFAPQRNRYNPLPNSLKCIVFEESSMISVELFKQLLDALQHPVQMIFLGDLQQLPPVYGSAILGFKLLELPVVELTEIYRQAADSPIISLAWRVASGSEVKPEEFEKLKVPEKLVIRPWKKKLKDDDALHICSKLFNQFVDQGVYNPEEDMVMIPFNRKFGTDEFNKNIAQHLGKKRDAEVYEIIAGYQKHYYAVGDKVLVEKQEALVQEIVINGRYTGNLPQASSKNLNRWGVFSMESAHIENSDGEMTDEDIDKLLALTMSSAGQDDDVKNQASHIMKCRVIGSEDIIEISTAGEFSATSFSYSLTVHKCQGSEWRKCFLVLHRSHAVMLSRELLYTAITRARESLYIICEPDSLVRGVASQRIKGNTIKEKAEYFKGKIEEVKGAW
jgi:exodeoxyribonuclease V alpha subunit